MVIVGGSFAGLAVARGLRKRFHVTIVDPHEHFEYTPGVLRLFVAPQHFRALTSKHRSHRVRLFFPPFLLPSILSSIRVRLPPCLTTSRASHQKYARR